MLFKQLKKQDFRKTLISYQTPSLALKIGHSLLKVIFKIEIIHRHALIAENAELARSADAFQKLQIKAVGIHNSIIVKHH